MKHLLQGRLQAQDAATALLVLAAERVQRAIEPGNPRLQRGRLFDRVVANRRECATHPEAKHQQPVTAARGARRCRRQNGFIVHLLPSAPAHSAGCYRPGCRPQSAAG